MYDLLGPGTILGYCTNVHPGGTLDELRRSMETHAVRVRELVCPGGKLPIGLWLSAASFYELLGSGNPMASRDHLLVPWLEGLGLDLFTLNAFPYGDFQGPVVKHAVYEPNWGQPERVHYVSHLVLAVSAWLPNAKEVSVSTLPLKWGPLPVDAELREKFAIGVIGAVPAVLPGFHIDFEPEPGCAFQHPADVVTYFNRLLRDGTMVFDPQDFRSAMRVCYDICHAAVMFDQQAAAVREYLNGRVRIGKVQISSALRVRFDSMSAVDRREARRQLLPFAEDRYLHQTMIRYESGERKFYEDLPLALAQAGDEPRGEWRIHYHVPIFLDRIGLLETTNDEIPAAIRAARELHDVKHFEVETYAWNVLPSGVWGGTVEEGIARELAWVKENAARWLA